MESTVNMGYLGKCHNVDTIHKNQGFSDHYKHHFTVAKPNKQKTIMLLYFCDTQSC